MTTLERALLCSYALNAEFTRGMVDTLETKSPDSISSFSPILVVGDRRELEGDEDLEAVDKAGVGWKATAR